MKNIEIIGSHFKIKAYVNTVFGMLWWKNKWSLVRSVNYVTSVYKCSVYALQTQKFSAIPLVGIPGRRTGCNEPSKSVPAYFASNLFASMYI